MPADAERINVFDKRSIAPLRCAVKRERSECKPDAKRKRDSAQHQERAQPSEDMRGSECNGNRAAHVGFYLIDKGLPELERQLGFDDPSLGGSEEPSDGFL